MTTLLCSANYLRKREPIAGSCRGAPIDWTGFPRVPPICACAGNRCGNDVRHGFLSKLYQLNNSPGSLVPVAMRDIGHLLDLIRQATAAHSRGVIYDLHPTLLIPDDLN
jgi:hypothetical protein